MRYIEINNISKTFNMDGDKREVLKNISFSIDKGEFICIVGPTGCGKTTLLRIIAGFEQPTDGSIICNGKKVEKPRMKGAFIFQEHDQLLPWKTAKQNVLYPMKIRKVPKDRCLEKVDALFSIVELTSKKDLAKYPHQLSSGMKQRVAIARALAMDPEILFMDEPFSSIDAFTRGNLHDNLYQLWEELKITIVFITHSIDEAIRLSTRIIIMGETPTRIIDDYQNYVKGKRIPSEEGYSELWDAIYNKIRNGVNKNNKITHI